MPISLVDRRLLLALGEQARSTGSHRERLTLKQWNALVEKAVRLGLAPLLAGRLGDSLAGQPVPAAVSQRLRAARAATAAANMRLFHELAGIFRTLAGAAIPAMALKGACLAEGVYGDVSSRPMIDIDLLVHRADLEAAEAALLAEGCVFDEHAKHTRRWYMDRHFHLPYRTGAGAIVELHWALTPAAAPVAVDLGGVWRRARTVRIAGQEALAPSTEDLLLHACLHTAYGHRFEDGLRPLCDIAQIVRREPDSVDWHLLLELARAWKASTFAYYPLSLAKHLLAANVPEELLAALVPGNADPALMDVLAEYVLNVPPLAGRGASSSAWRAIEASSGPSGWRSKPGILWRAAFPPAKRLRALYGLRGGKIQTAVWYVIRPFDLILRHGRAMAHWVLGSRTAERELARERARTTIEQAFPSGPDSDLWRLHGGSEASGEPN